MTVNKGNLVTRRAFAERDGQDLNRIKILAQVTNKAMSTAYQMTEEVGLYGSGTPSPLHMVGSLIEKLVELGDLSAAHAMAEYPRSFLNSLQKDAPEGDAVHKLNFLLKTVSDINFNLKGRSLDSVPLGEMKGISEMVMTAVTTASELGMMIDASIQAKESNHTGAPITGERLRQVG